jgi:hypothetical protein
LICILGVVLQTILDVYIYILPYNTMFVWISSVISNSNFICRNRHGCSILYLNEKAYCHLFLFLGDLWVVYRYWQTPFEVMELPEVVWPEEALFETGSMSCACASGTFCTTIIVVVPLRMTDKTTGNDVTPKGFPHMRPCATGSWGSHRFLWCFDRKWRYSYS